MRSRLIVFALVAATTAIPMPLRSQEKMFHVTPEEVESHRSELHRMIVPEEDEWTGGAPELHLVVAPDGAVASVTCSNSKYCEPAIAQARTWRYEPFLRAGVPMTATFTDYIYLRGPESKPRVHVPFPSIPKNAALTEIKLQRTGCFGTCPAYTVTISGSGLVIFSDAGDPPHIHHDRIPASQVRTLLEQFRDADFFSLLPEYASDVTDSPTFVLTLKLGSAQREVIDYVGQNAGMPEAVSDLEDAVDRVSGDARWLTTNADTVPSLKREGFDFHSDEAGQLLTTAAYNGSYDAVEAFLKAGTPPDPKTLTFSFEYMDDGVPHITPMVAAAMADHADVVRLLLDSRHSISQDELDRTLIASARSKDVELVQTLLDHGADPDAEAEDHISPLMAAASAGDPATVALLLPLVSDVNRQDFNGWTAVRHASEWHYDDTPTDDESEADRALIIHLLAAAGADLSLPDKYGATPLHETFLDKVATALIADGANISAPQNNGKTPLFTTMRASIAEALIAAGADVELRDANGVLLTNRNEKPQAVIEKARAAEQAQPAH